MFGLTIFLILQLLNLAVALVSFCAALTCAWHQQWMPAIFFILLCHNCEMGFHNQWIRAKEGS